MGRVRAAVLISVHVLFLAHLTHWFIAGRTVSPVEPSEAMETLQTGRVNAGAIFFGAALLSTLIFGRFVCGWACHIVALQDLCGWVLRKLGLKPKPFRSRVLVFVPLIAALYMFVWPSVVQWWLSVERGAWTNHLLKSAFWETFPGPVIAVLTLVVCGFVIVYFLGNKGFCTYACPYGGFFGVLERWSPGRIRVTEDCNACGHCSAVCTSNVRVAEEVRLFGMVVDPGCMKCMDCVSVCPNDALYFGFGRPSAGVVARGERRAVRFDGTWAEEIGVAIVFLLSLAIFRGLYGVVPFLFSLGISAILSYLALKTWHVLSRRDVSMHHVRLRRAGTLQRGGRTFLASMVVLGLFVGHCTLMRVAQWYGERWFDRTTAPVGGWHIAGDLTRLVRPAEREAAERARPYLQLVSRWGLTRVPPVELALAWIDLTTGNTDAAVARIRRMSLAEPRDVGTLDHLGVILAARGEFEESEICARRAIELDPEFHHARFNLGLLLLRRGDAAAAADEIGRARALDRMHSGLRHDSRPLNAMAAHYFAESLRRAGRLDDAITAERRPGAAPEALASSLQRAIVVNPADGSLHRSFGLQMARLGRREEARAALQRALQLDASDVMAHLHLAGLRLQIGDPIGAKHHLDEAEQLAPRSWQVQSDIASALAAMGRFDEAVTRGRVAQSLNSYDADIRANIGASLLATGDLPGATLEYREAVRLAPDSLEFRFRLGWLLGRAGQRAEAAELLRSVASSPDAKLRDMARQALVELDASR